ncbi:MAG: TonB-dependent receptor [Bacteroidales bacterium]|nr:TonB-dependent receptor [Bacteroidales bacterium]
MEQLGIDNPKSLSSLIPGIHLPDYGASLTSSIYVRGLGSRMENPVIGLYIDDFPVLDKNSYDLDYLDLASVTFLHGPQGTSYGRNTMAGVLSLRTMAPDGEKGMGLRLEGGSARHAGVQLSYRSGNWAATAGYRHSAGFFPNEYKGELCDPYDGLQLRLRWDKSQRDSVQLNNTLHIGLSSEGGFAYGSWDGDTLHPVNYNDEGSYRRFTLLEGFKARIIKRDFSLDCISSLQVLMDDMHMDQDYMPLSIFTLEQQQKSAALTMEAILRPARTFKHWRPMTGFFGFFKANGMFAPVTFKRDGIRQLILDNANAGIPDDIGFLEIPDESFPVNSLFNILSWNAAVFHESAFVFGNWQFTVGVRLDYEGAWMAYDCTAKMNYQLVGMMSTPRLYSDHYTGSLSHGSPIILPKISAEYRGIDGASIFGTISKGYRAGGFNTQIFSDILQSRIMGGMMADMGVYMDDMPQESGAGNTEYQPEEAWNFEIGGSYRSGGFRASASVFRIEAINQQLTVFPPGKSTGRMMTNAGRSRSIGIETEAGYHSGDIDLQASWSWNDARFMSYSDGNADYSGNRIPYSPAHTLFAAAGYKFSKASLGLHLRGTGPIAWNEANTLSEPFYFTLGARAAFNMGTRTTLYLRGENLTGTRYRAFYFKSMGNEFFQAGKPRTLILGIQIRMI